MYTAANDLRRRIMRSTRSNGKRAAKLSYGIQGEGVAINRTQAGDFVLHEIRPSGAVREVGKFRNSVDAWRALDALDTAAV
jgi:hypothetical protein